MISSAPSVGSFQPMLAKRSQQFCRSFGSSGRMRRRGVFRTGIANGFPDALGISSWLVNVEPFDCVVAQEGTIALHVCAPHGSTGNVDEHAPTRERTKDARRTRLRSTLDDIGAQGHALVTDEHCR